MQTNKTRIVAIANRLYCSPLKFAKNNFVGYS